jgi:hypothetical protein
MENISVRELARRAQDTDCHFHYSSVILGRNLTTLPQLAFSLRWKVTALIHNYLESVHDGTSATSALFCCACTYVLDHLGTLDVPLVKMRLS